MRPGSFRALHIVRTKTGVTITSASQALLLVPFCQGRALEHPELAELERLPMRHAPLPNFSFLGLFGFVWGYLYFCKLFVL